MQRIPSLSPVRNRSPTSAEASSIGDACRLAIIGY